ncbi:MAG: hypothetical protein KF683_01825 [Rubrivivax sp.]|nr:hypothetical protein [Rubrivivax sp.]
MLAMAASAVGVYDRTVVLHGSSVNGSGVDLALADLSLRLCGQVAVRRRRSTARRFGA